MPVNTAALKTFAPAMRRQLLEAVGRKLDLLLTRQTPDTLSTHTKQISELREQEAQNREQLLERVAYSWFNRLTALRYLDARGWHPFGARVLMPQMESETQPELLKLLRSGSLPAELQPHTDERRLQGLLDGRIPTAQAGSDPQGEVYRELLLAVCRSYHQLLPMLFEGLDDASELLLPDDLLSDGSIAGGFRSQISDSDCEDVEIIGWLYQFYISEKKDQVIGKVVKSEDIPAATQLFTPNWIVKYMVQNSLGAQWLATYPSSALKGQMEYYIEPAEQTDDVKVQLAAITPESLNPEELTLIDPACGSGHILAEAYELFNAIYLERGYQQREIPQLILEKNLYGLDIDERAAQLTGFVLMMKGRGDDRRLFERGIQLNVMALVNSDGLDVEALANAVNLADHGLKLADLVDLKQLFEHATTFGSLIQVPDGLADKFPAFRRLSELKGQNMYESEALKFLESLVRQAELLAARYDEVVTNPPYMGTRMMDRDLKRFAVEAYTNSKADLYSMFLERGMRLVKGVGQLAMVTMQGWMFLSSQETLRRKILSEQSILSLLHLGPRAFSQMSGEVVQVAAFSLRGAVVKGWIPSFFRLVAGDEDDKQRRLRQGDECFTRATQEKFRDLPGSPVAYWVSNSFRTLFTDSPMLEEIAKPRQGLATANNAAFLRYWWEVPFPRIGFDISSREVACRSGYKWFPHNKGGGFRRWYGNIDWVVNWENDGAAIKQDKLDKLEKGLCLPSNSKPKNMPYYFRSGISWSDLSTDLFGARYVPAGFVFDVSGPTMFPAEANDAFWLLGYVNNAIFQAFLDVSLQGIHYSNGVVSKMPVPLIDDSLKACVSALARKAKDASQRDWNRQETSFDFSVHPLTEQEEELEAALDSLVSRCEQECYEMKRLEEENNLLFVNAYGLKDELTPEVPIKQITLTVNPAYRYGGNLAEKEQWARFRRDTVSELLSYATGCMMGRYSLNQPGLILANSRDSQAEQLTAYEQKVGKPLSEVQFKPDPDGIIPVLDSEWFEDDIVARTREFLGVTFPESSVAENLRFIEVSLGKDIRKYFCSEFYKDHLQTYKKRPIYWLVQSPKKGFSCLIYLHRYTKDTLNQVLNNYFRPYLQKLEARLAQLGLDQLNDDLPTRERTAARKEAEKITKVLKECQAWEQDALLPLAQQRIELDLDDGVKVNYLKLQDVLAPIPGLAAKED